MQVTKTTDFKLNMQIHWLAMAFQQWVICDREGCSVKFLFGHQLCLTLAISLSIRQMTKKTKRACLVIE